MYFSQILNARVESGSFFAHLYHRGIATSRNFTTSAGGKVLVKAMLTERVAAGVAFMPFHFGGHWQGKSLRHKYPPGADPYVLGEASNMVGTYGYDSVTQMQESKVTLCRIEAA